MLITNESVFSWMVLQPIVYSLISTCNVTSFVTALHRDIDGGGEMVSHTRPLTDSCLDSSILI
jgi:hypothetical protein